MAKILIGGVEYEETDAAELISKGQDYTKKTQELADKERIVQSDLEKVGKYVELDEYLARNPELAKNMKNMVDNHIKSSTSPANNIRNVNPANRNANQGFTNVGYSDFTPDNFDNQNNQFSQPNYMTREEFEKEIQERETKRAMEDGQKEMIKELTKQAEELKSKGYNEEEVKKIATYAQKNNLWLTTAAKTMAFDGILPDRFKSPKTDDDKGKENPGLLKGQSGSGFEMPDPEKDLVKYGGDPIEWLRDHPEKLTK